MSSAAAPAPTPTATPTPATATATATTCDGADCAPGPLISLVVAMADDGVIGRDGGLPWHLPDDLKHFRAVTLGKPVLMGRRTFEAIGKPLPGRRNLVLSRASAAGQGRDFPEGVERVASLQAALARVQGAAELCVIGGAQLYALALPHARRIYLTRVHGMVGGDVLFPVRELSGWQQVECTEHPPDARHAYAMSFIRLDRIAGAATVSG